MAALEWEPMVDAANIGVAAKDGIVTLTGHVASYAQKLAAEEAVRRVRGAKAIAEEIEVRLPSDKKTADDEIAERALRILSWDTTVPTDEVSIKVERGWVTRRVRSIGNTNAPRRNGPCTSSVASSVCRISCGSGRSPNRMMSGIGSRMLSGVTRGWKPGA